MTAGHNPGNQKSTILTWHVNRIASNRDSPGGVLS